MGKKTKTGKSRLDTYYYLAKEQGYRSRAAFKLIQLNKKYQFLKSASVVLDLCAAPGGWLQVIREQVPIHAKVIGIDRVPIAPISKCETFTVDLKDCAPLVQKSIGLQKADVIVHDGAPNVGVEWKHDAYQQSVLVLLALKVCTTFLKKQGLFVTKVFRCKEYTYLLWVFHQLFQSVEATKPEASRKVSAEMYVICKGYKRPEKLDPKLLDPKFVFKEVEMNAKGSTTASSHSLLTSVFTPSQSRRHREGYAETSTGLLYQKLKLKEFIEHSDPATLLASHHAIIFPSLNIPSTSISTHSTSTLKNSSSSKENNDPALMTDPELIEQQYAKYATPEIQELANDLQVLGKRDYKRLMKWRLHVRQQEGLDSLLVSTSQENQNKVEEEEKEEAGTLVTDEMLETLALKAEKERQLRLKREQRKRKEKLAQTHLKLHDPLLRSSSSSSSSMNVSSMHIDEDPNDELSVSLFFDRPLFKQAQLLVPKPLISEEEAPLQDMELESEVEEHEESKDSKLHHYITSSSTTSSSSSEEEEEEEDEDDEELDPDLLDDEEEEENEEDEEELDSFHLSSSPHRTQLQGKHSKQDQSNDQPEEGEEEDEEDDKMLSDVSMDEEDLRPKPSSNVLHDAMSYTLAQQFVHSNKSDLIDASFHRYAFQDAHEDLPSWFVQDEQKYMRPQLKPSKEAQQVFAERLKKVNVRSIKKVMEAKLRKKKKHQQLLMKQNLKAHHIATSEEWNESTKARAIDQLFSKKKLQKKENKVTLVVAKGGNKKLAGRPKGVKGRYKMVDKRMKKEKRALKRVQEKKRASKKGKPKKMNQTKS